mgnify:CR=1 FL=1
MKTRVSTITCPSCGDEIFSRATHDCHSCSCETVAIDGGREYVKICFKDKMPKQRIRYVNASRQELYDDWNKRIDKYGRIEKKNKSIKL